MADSPSKLTPGGTKRGSDSVDRKIAELARIQHGIVARRQLLAFAGSSAIVGRVQRGLLHPLYRGVYAVGHSAVDTKGRWMAATLAVGPDSALSHRSAGRLWGLTSGFGTDPEVTIPRGWRGQAGVCVRRSPLPADETERVDGIPVTGASRTILDLASLVSMRQLERAMNEAEVLRLTERVSIPRLLERYPRRRGTAVLRTLLGDEAGSGGATRNDFEERFATLLDAHGLVRPRFNADLAIRGRFFKVDCLWGSERLVVELDGRAVHGTRRAFEKDRERDRLLQVDGWRVVRVTWRQLRDEPLAVVADLRRLLDGAAASTL